MNFNDFPLDIQLEILKYKPFFRRINKQYYKEGELLFMQLYGALPISKNEFIKYQRHFDGMVFNTNKLIASYLSYGKYNTFQSNIALSPSYIKSNFYCTAIELNILKFGNNKYYNVKSLNNIHWSRDTLIYDLKSTMAIMKNRNISIDKTQYLNSLFKSNGTDLENLLVKLKYILYLAPPQDINDLKLHIDVTFYQSTVREKDRVRYNQYMVNVNELYEYYMAMNTCY